MKTNYVALAVPFFIISMILEMVISHYRKDGKYRFNDSISNLSNGLGQQAIGVFSRVVQLYCYTWVFNQTSYWSFSNQNINHWIIALLGADLAYYFFHRASHRINLLVGSHVVHHQSEEYNLSVAMRQSWITRFYSWFFYLPLAIIGVTPEMFLAVMAIVIIYQFWVHTEYIGKMGLLEYIVVTPSHHRVHHGRNPQYVDKNYGAIFIWWDMLFGSFQKEEEQVVYGIVNPSNTWNPLYANVRYFKKLYGEAKNANTLTDKFKVWISPPEWRPKNLSPYGEMPIVTRESVQKYDLGRDGVTKLWILAQFILSLILFAFILKNKTTFNFDQKAYLSLLIVWSLTNVGGIQERKNWVLTSQLLFLAAFFVGTLTYFNYWI